VDFYSFPQLNTLPVAKRNRIRCKKTLGQLLVTYSFYSFFTKQFSDRLLENFPVRNELERDKGRSRQEGSASLPQCNFGWTRILICALPALRLHVHGGLSWPLVSSVALHVVERTFPC
jgi:hypothetical protein